LATGERLEERSSSRGLAGKCGWRYTIRSLTSALPILLAALLGLQSPPADPVLSARILQLFDTAITDDAQSDAG
jgi:hypothetical protein